MFVNNKTGQIFKEGENMTRPQLAYTMKVISEGGASAFYNGSLTDKILEDLKEIGLLRRFFYCYWFRIVINDGYVVRTLVILVAHSCAT